MYSRKVENEGRTQPIVRKTCFGGHLKVFRIQIVETAFTIPKTKMGPMGKMQLTPLTFNDRLSLIKSLLSLRSSL